MKKFSKLMGAFFALVLSLSSAKALDYNQNIIAIFGGGNPNTGWTVGSDNDITLALRAKNRENSSTANVDGVYSEPVGYQLPANNRACWNWEFSVSTQVGLVIDNDYFVLVDLDPSECIDYQTIEVLTYWNDNSFGDSLTANGQGSENFALSSPTATVVQQSQNLVFIGGNPNLDATYNYVLYAVAKGAGPDGARLAETSIVVIVGAGGTPCPDSDGDGYTDDIDGCINSNLQPSVDVNGPPKGKDKGGVTDIPNIVLPGGCTIQDLVNHIAATSVEDGEYKERLRELAKQLEEDGILSKKQVRDFMHKAKIFDYVEVMP